MTTFIEDNSAYEAWLATKCHIVQPDLELKHVRMRKSAFLFLRATYFRWAKTIEKTCPELVGAPAVASVGDIHTENFGTWRDGDGRLIWGVNDFDEAATMPYAFDLVRLTASATLDPKRQVEPHVVATAILTGYRKGLHDPQPTSVYENGRWMMAFVQPSDEGSANFWLALLSLPEEVPPADVLAALRHSLPSGTNNVRTYARPQRGGGSLGRPRYVAVGSWQGATVVREAKAWVPSAWGWAHGTEGTPADYMKLATGRYRSPDPNLEIPYDLNFVIRRLAPDSRRLDLGDDAVADLRTDLLSAMGADLAAIHGAEAGSGAAILADLDGRPSSWLYEASEKAEAAVQLDFEAWTG